MGLLGDIFYARFFSFGVLVVLGVESAELLLILEGLCINVGAF